jgi:TolB protein
MNKGTILKATAISGAVVLLIGAAPITASATHPGPNGRIAFLRWDNNGLAQVWTANPDLTAAQQLTSGNANSGWPAWAPNGSRIAFDSDRSDPDPTDDVGINDVFTMLPDGTDVRKVTDSVGFSGDPAFSPDGSLIAFDADRGGPNLSIYVIGPDSTGMRRVTTPPAGSTDTEPRFSPDGQKLVFTRVQGQSTKSGRTARDISAVFTINVDGSGLNRISGWGHKAGQADWSPDGQRIVFEMACCRLGAGGIFTVNADGSRFTALVNGHGVTGIGNETALQFDGYYDPVWSPDGTKIIAGREFLADDGTFTVGLVIVDPANGGVDWVSSTVDQEHQPDWGTAPLQ